jgi:hypothetical protein
MSNYSEVSVEGLVPMEAVLSIAVNSVVVMEYCL